jgi:RNA polymerase sigma factor (sigma-70 family)
MPFPQTHLTLIERLAGGGGGESDWKEFFDDYWGPVCRFARQRGNLSPEDAEDVASESLEAIVRNNLLARWSADRSSKLRTLICAVVRNILANRARLTSGREKVVRGHLGALDRYLNLADSAPEETAPEVDAFYAAWAEDLLNQAVDGVFTEYNEAGKGDYVRILYDRICKELPFQEIADELKLTPAAAEAHFRQAKQRLADRLQSLIRRQVSRYSSPGDAEAEFVVEWGRLGDHLREHGGLEVAVRRSCGTTSA